MAALEEIEQRASRPPGGFRSRVAQLLGLLRPDRSRPTRHPRRPSRVVARDCPWIVGDDEREDYQTAAQVPPAAADGRLDIGLTLPDYSERVGDASVAYDRIDFQSLGPNCIDRAGVPAEATSVERSNTSNATLGTRRGLDHARPAARAVLSRHSATASRFGQDPRIFGPFRAAEVCRERVLPERKPPRSPSRHRANSLHDSDSHELLG